MSVVWLMRGRGRDSPDYDGDNTANVSNCIKGDLHTTLKLLTSKNTGKRAGSTCLNKNIEKYCL
jgi:hypothetical protein